MKPIAYASLKVAFVLAPTAFASGLSGTSIGDSSSGLAKQTIVSRIKIHKVSDLNFGEASPGDGAKNIAPGNSENRENASFQIEGEPLRSFQIILPGRNSVRMLSGGGGPNREITIQEFSSTPSQVGTLDSVGRKLIFVGASRGPIPSAQKRGDYLGQFNVTVVY